MAWIEDPFGKVLLVKQTAGRKAWTFPGGKVRRGETLFNALKRELQEEVGLTVDVASPIDIFDRAEKGNLTILFRVILKPQNLLIKHDNEIEKFAFRHSAPRISTPSLRFFWRRAQKSFDPLSGFIS